MKKYRIVRELQEHTTYFMPQKKTLFGWKYLTNFHMFKSFNPYNPGIKYRIRCDFHNDALEAIKKDAKVEFAKGNRILIL